MISDTVETDRIDKAVETAVKQGAERLPTVEAADWLWPHFNLPADILEFHNDLAAANVGSQVTWTLGNKIEALKAIVATANRGVSSQRFPTDGIKARTVEHKDMPKMLTGIARNYYSRVFGWVVETLNYLQSTHTNLSQRTSGIGAGTANQLPLLKSIIAVCGLSANKELSASQIQAAKQLPGSLQLLLGINPDSLMSDKERLNIELIEAYLKFFYAQHTKYTEKGRYVYDGPVPEDPMDDLKAAESQSIGWDEQTHVVGRY